MELLRKAWAAGRQVTAEPLLFQASTLERLLLAPWRENLRGLDRLVHSFGMEPGRGEITPSELPAWVDAAPLVAAAAAPVVAATPRPKIPTKAELEDAIARLGSVRAVARHFARDRRQIHRWVKAHGLSLGAARDDDEE